MAKIAPLELRVGVDVGCYSHNVAIGLSSGEILDEFEVSHNPEGFLFFFSRIEKALQQNLWVDSGSGSLPTV